MGRTCRIGSSSIQPRATFSGNPPFNAKGIFDIKVIARDDGGKEASTSFRLKVGSQGGERVPQDAKKGQPGQPAQDRDATAPPDARVNINVERRAVADSSQALPGKPSLSGQLKAVSRSSPMAEAAALLERLLKAAGIGDNDRAV